MQYYFGILYSVILSDFVSWAKICLETDDVPLYITQDYKLQFHNLSNLSDYDLTVVFHWNISEDSNITGFLYHFTDKDRSTGSSPGFFWIPGIPKPPCEGVNDTIWAVDSNGTSVQCEVPCERYMESPCSYRGICTYLKTGYKAISRENRTLELRAEFGRAYDFQMMTYNQWSNNPTPYSVEKPEKAAVFCRHELITKYGIDREVANEFCEKEQKFGINTHSAGPVSNLSLARMYRNLTTNRGVAIFQWQDPHDVFPNVTLDHFAINVLKTGKTSGKVDVNEKSSDGFYRLTISDIEFDREFELRITPVVNEANCTGCTEYGRVQTLRHTIPDIDACVGDSMTMRYCVEIANCTDFSKFDNVAANCSCTLGYAGNGISRNFTGGVGCTNYDSCSSGDARNETCDPEAVCVDHPPPSWGVDCYCPDGYVGDGYRSGYGCRERSLIIGLSVGIPAAIIVIMAAVLLVLRWRHMKKTALEKKISHFMNGDVSYTAPMNGNNVIMNGAAVGSTEKGIFGEKWELDRDTVELKGIIGRGNFGVVQKATLKKGDEQVLVAVKMLSGNPPEALKNAFLTEISMIAGAGSHDNLIGMIGCCTIGEEPIYMVSEYMKYGDLLHFLWNAREQRYRDADPIYTLTELNIYQITSQVASGMNYLKGIRIIHGDLAARNVLVGEGLKCKISDFGLANDVYKYGMIKGLAEKVVPLKWISPERMMEGKVPVTWKSDVWSFGVLLYEAITLGATPYPGIGRDEIFNKLKSGYRMEKPDYCSKYLYNIMLQCWHWAASKRPSFKKLEEDLTKPFSNPDTETYVNLQAYVPNLEDDSEPPAQNGTSITPGNGHANGTAIREGSEMV